MVKVISINGSRFALPEGMAAKDVQALAGFLVTLTPVQSEYDYDTSDYMSHLASQGTEVRVDTLELVDRLAAKKQHEESYARYKAKRDAEATA
jgi:GrpB-like predicted nucleotidyltransferase (UPF0157 family)